MEMNIFFRLSVARNGLLRRPTLVLLLSVGALLILSALRTREENAVQFTLAIANARPPTYKKLRQWETSLPQHNLDLPFPEGKNGRYVKFSNQANWIGWNNCFSELLMNAYLAYITNRGYVFQDYLWLETHYSWPREQWQAHGPRTPLAAIVSGPISGGSFEPGDLAPRAISEAWFNVVCPPDVRRIINTHDVKPHLADASGIDVLNQWRKILLDSPERCIEIVPAPYDEDPWSQTFDLRLWGSPLILTLWDAFSTSPISRLLEPSSTVLSAIEHNTRIFVPRGAQPIHAPSKNPYNRMLSMHLRRGDYEEHCKWLASSRAPFYGWNQLPNLPDRLGSDSAGPDTEAKLMERCWPETTTIVQKAALSRRDLFTHNPWARHQLDIVYILTNEKGPWIDELKEALRKDGWDSVSASLDLMLDSEQKDVSMMIDQEIARRAAVFIGNGWSSLSSNVAHRRLVDGKDPITIRFS